MSSALPWERSVETLLTDTAQRLGALWRRGGRFSILLVGDGWGREEVLAYLRPVDAPAITAATSLHDLTCTVSPTGAAVPSLLDRARNTALVIAAADLLDIDVVALMDCDRILATAPDVESVAPALLSRLPVIIGIGVRPTRRCVRPPTGDDPLRWSVDALDRNGFHDHRLDIGTARAARIAASAGMDTRAVVARFVIEPRLAPMLDVRTMSPSSSEGVGVDTDSSSGGDEGELGHDDAEVTRAPDGDTEPGDLPAWATIATARRYASTRRPGRRGAPAASSRGRVRRVLDYHPTRRLDITHTLLAAVRQGGIDENALRSSLRTRRGGRLTIVIIDRSDSMGRIRSRAAAAMATSVIGQVTRDRSELAVISARGATAHVALEPTTDLPAATQILRSLPTGGGTPLASAFLLTVALIPPETTTRVLVLTDGSANVRLEPGVGVGVSDGAESARDQAASCLRLLAGLCEQVLVVPHTAPGVRIRETDLEWLRRAGAVVRTPASAAPDLPSRARRF